MSPIILNVVPSAHRRVRHPPAVPYRLPLSPGTGFEAVYALFGLAPGAFPAFGADDVAFTAALLTEENVMMLPGTVFAAPGFVRVVFCAPRDALATAFDRLGAFAARHRAAGWGAR